MICTIVYISIVAVIVVYLINQDQIDKGIYFYVLATMIACIVLLPPVLGCHYEGNEELINDRLYIINAMKSEDLELRAQAVQRAIEYNDKVASGKQALANPWINWFVDRIWRDAELIPLDYTTVTMKENS